MGEKFSPGGWRMLNEGRSFGVAVPCSSLFRTAKVLLASSTSEGRAGLGAGLICNWVDFHRWAKHDLITSLIWRCQ